MPKCASCSNRTLESTYCASCEGRLIQAGDAATVARVLSGLLADPNPELRQGAVDLLRDAGAS